MIRPLRISSVEFVVSRRSYLIRSTMPMTTRSLRGPPKEAVETRVWAGAPDVLAAVGVMDRCPTGCGNARVGAVLAGLGPPAAPPVTPGGPVAAGRSRTAVAAERHQPHV